MPMSPRIRHTSTAQRPIGVLEKAASGRFRHAPQRPQGIAGFVTVEPIAQPGGYRFGHAGFLKLPESRQARRTHGEVIVMQQGEQGRHVFSRTPHSQGARPPSE